jgi:hypothetical protein
MKSKYSNDYKSSILQEGLDRRVANIKKDLYKKSKYITHDDDGIVESVTSPLWCDWVKVYKNNPRYDCALKLNESKYRKAKKVREKISDLIKDGRAYFLTLTFRNDVFEKTSPETRRKYVARYLKEQSPVYVANIDFGGKKGREHYHAIVEGKIDYKYWFDNYGCVVAELIRNQDNDVKRTSKYLSKLTNHALKVQGIVPRLIYSRNTI